MTDRSRPPPGHCQVRYRVGDERQWISTRDMLEAQMLGGVPEMEQYRRYFGRALTPATIEGVIRQAELGHMRDMTDLISETIFIDAHFGSVVGKRFRALAAMKVRVTPASGDGISPEIAAKLADLVRQQIAWVPRFRQAVLRLNWGHCHGRAALEKVWVENPVGTGVRWRLESLNWIHPRRLGFGKERELRVRDGMHQGLGFDSTGMALRDYPMKFIGFTPQLFNEYPEREGFGPRALYWSFHKRFSWRERMQLLEIFGKPWRVAYTDLASVQPSAIEQAAQVADEMGNNATATMPPGVKIDTQMPGDKAGENHASAARDADDQISKLVLGQTRTTDAKPGALGSDGDQVAADAEASLIAADGWNLSDVLTEQLAADIVVLNAGPEYLDHCPRIEIVYELPKNRTGEAESAQKTLALGVPLKEDEVYERTGWTKPQPGDAVVRQQPAAAPAVPGQPAATPPGKQETMPGDDPNDDAGGGAAPLGQNGEAAPEQQQLRGGLDPLVVTRLTRLLERISPSSPKTSSN